MTTWTVRDIPDLTGTTAIVTGASAGVGRSTAQALSAAGARVVLAVRNSEKGRKAAAGMPGKTEVRELDLADLASVRTFAAGWDGPIDLLVNNAGISAPSLARTADGFESSFGVNHLGHFALTNLLFEHLAGRVVTVASQAERMGRLDFGDLDWQRRPFRGSRAYNDSKLANLLFTAELQRRLIAAGSGVLAQAAHPGLVATDIYQRDGHRPPLPWAVALKLLAQGPDRGALPVLYAAVADIPGDSFTGPSHLGHMRGAPELIARSATARDLDLAARLWDVSERLTRVNCPV
ncbi:NAD(P)-dependent dehydrogenase, short-chain alcohol dehydrogenase family [Actinacidiphila yanglinensis]|uniref:NAD(P)-dependent dehydrogenase, short-chain alcohol dehydrogenase family n=1 Tax=Actinacidiphila yanglinensis TaxID=310779 RepID=A0A1H5X8Y7_9ACTN|nr:oxidoreductase [Actinacidiphila yanglinensis]SEG08214.1 NAD(P)-dependent dehydrogenase, short-chain alcohol dehydrogenase family [Actinacidiphila yanglinensis]